MKRDVSVRTEVWRGGRMFADLGTMRWFGVSDEIVTWLAGSCRTTAMRLLVRPTVVDGYEIRYQTIVTRADGAIDSDTGEIAFDGMSYEDVVEFEHWALEQLRELVELFRAGHGRETAPRHGNRLRFGLRLLWRGLTTRMLPK